MTISADPVTPVLSTSDHDLQLRRAVIASTVGTAIEWYDFFLYSTVTGLVFAKLFFPHSDPWVGTLEAFAIYAVGFIARPVGAAIFGHYGDRIGRKSTLIATLLLMGLATAAVAMVPTYQSIGIWGAVLLTVLRFIQGVGVGGEWGGSVLMSMEWARNDKSRGLIASWPQFGVPCGLFLANLAVLAFSQMSGEKLPRLGLAHSVRAQSRAGRRRPLHPARHHGDAGVRQAARRAEDRPHADADGDQAASEGNPAVGLRAHGRAGAVLHLHRLHLLLRHRHAARVARLPAHGGAGGLRAVVRLDPGVRASVGSHRAEEHVHDRRCRDRRVRLHLFRHAQHRLASRSSSLRSSCR